MRRVLVTVLLVLFASVSQSGWAAEGGGWPLDGPAGTLLGFGMAYFGQAGSSTTHHGIDLVAEPGTRVRVVRAGTVTFAGSVPAGGGGTMLAVTIDSGDVRISYLPLADVSVTAGQRVEAGSPIGFVAASGDASSGQPHLHIGARVGSLYVDPAAYLVPPVVAVTTDGEPVHEGAAGEVFLAHPAPLGIVAAVAVGAPASAPGSLVPAPGTAGATVPAHGTAIGESVVGASVSGLAGAAEAWTTGIASARTRLVVSTASGETGVERLPSPAAGSVHATSDAIRDGVGAHLDSTLSAADRAAASSTAIDEIARPLDRREALTPKSLPGIAAAFGIVSMLGVASLWPVWRSVAPPTLDVGAISKDVAALVGR